MSSPVFIIRVTRTITTLAESIPTKNKNNKLRCKNAYIALQDSNIIFIRRAGPTNSHKYRLSQFESEQGENRIDYISPCVKNVQAMDHETRSSNNLLEVG